jgi:exosortase A
MNKLRFASLLPVALVLGVLCYFYSSTLASFGVRWQVPGGAYSHGFPLLALCAILVLRQLPKVANTSPSPNWTAVGIVLGLSLLWLFGRVSDVLVLQQAVLPALFLFVITALYGSAAGRQLRFPFLLFYAAVPLWDALNPFLQWLTVKVCTFGLYLIGIPAFIEENQISIPAGTFQVAGGCSGLSYLLMFSTIGALFGHLYYREWWHKVMLLCIAASMGLACNWTRVFSLVLVGQNSNMQSPLMANHEGMGWVVFALCLLPFFFIATHLEKHYSHLRAEPARPPANTTKSAFPRFSTILATTTAAIIGPLLFGSTAHTPIRGQFEVAVSDSQSTLINYAPEAVWEPDFDNFDQHLVLQFPTRNPEMQVHMLVYFFQEQGKELIHWNNEIADEKEWKKIAESDWQTPSGGRIKLAELRSLSGRAELLYWYSVGGFATASPFLAKVLQLPAFLLGRQDAALLAIFYQCKADVCAEIRDRAGREVETVNNVYSNAIKSLPIAPGSRQ